MSTARFILWCLLCALSAVLLILLERMIRRKENRVLQILFFVLRAVSIPFLGLLLVYFDSDITWLGNLQLGALYIGAFGTVLGDIACVLFSFLKRGSLKRENTRLLLTAVCVSGLFLYGTWNSMAVFPGTYTFSSDKLGKEYRIVFVSDVHTGSTQRMSTIRKNLEKAVASQPDLMILGGDMTDEFTSKEEMETFYSIVGDLGVPVIAVYGNHDRQQKAGKVGGRTYSNEDLERAMRENGVRLLKEEYMEFGEDLVILGREDLSEPDGRTVTDRSGNPNPEAMLLVIDHQQLTEDDLQSVGGDLQLSGHSHAGQYFPLRFIYECAGANPCGEYVFGNSVMYVSSGFSGWRIPFRTEERCHYEVITLSPANP